MSIKVGIIGVGTLGCHHARLYQQSAQAELVGIFDTNLRQLQNVATELQVQAFPDQEALIEAVDAVSVAVPTDRHFDIVHQLLQCNKHVLVEKPITHDVMLAHKLVLEARKRELVLAVGHVERFNPMMDYLQQKADNPRFIEVHRLAPYPPSRPDAPPRGTEVGVVMDLMIHDIDLVLALMKQTKVTRVEAAGVPVLSQTEDIANARLIFENGCQANLTASRISPEYMRKVRLFQSDCYLSLDYQNQKGEICQKTDQGLIRESVPIASSNALFKELEDFITCIAARQAGEKQVPMVTGEHGLRALEVAVEITRQIMENQTQ